MPAVLTLFGKPDPENDKVLGTAEAVNVWPKATNDGLLAWRQRPGLTLAFSVNNLTGFDRLFSSFKAALLAAPLIPVNEWAHATVGGTTTHTVSFTDSTAANRTVCFAYLSSGNPTFYVNTNLNSATKTFKPTLSVAAKVAYVNIGTTVTAVHFAYDTDASHSGFVVIPFCKLIARDWVGAGQSAYTVYYP